MPREQSAGLFMPPNLLKAKVGSKTGSGIDMGALRRASEAMKEINGEFASWAAQDVEKLVAARAAFAKSPDAKSRAALLRAAHDMKGQAAVFNYPLIARVSGSLAQLIDELPQGRELPLSLVDAHVNAVHVIYRDKVMDESNTMAAALAKELESQVAAVLKS